MTIYKRPSIQIMYQKRVIIMLEFSLSKLIKLFANPSGEKATAMATTWCFTLTVFICS